jgi:hypothetical protein
MLSVFTCAPKFCVAVHRIAFREVVVCPPCVSPNMISGSGILYTVHQGRGPHGAVQCMVEVPYISVHREVVSNCTHTHERQPKRVRTACRMQGCFGFAQLKTQASMHFVCLLVPAHASSCFSKRKRSMNEYQSCIQWLWMWHSCVCGRLTQTTCTNEWSMEAKQYTTVNLWEEAARNHKAQCNPSRSSGLCKCGVVRARHIWSGLGARTRT